LDLHGFNVCDDQRQPIAYIAGFELMGQMIQRMMSLEKSLLEETIESFADTNLPVWFSRLDWRYSQELKDGVNDLFERVSKQRSGEHHELSSFENLFPEGVRKYYLDAIVNHLDMDRYRSILLDTEDSNRKAKFISLMERSVLMQLAQETFDPIYEKFTRMRSSFPLSTIAKYNDVIMRIWEGCDHSAAPFRQVIERLGGRKYGTGNEAIGPVWDSYEDMPSAIAEPSRTFIIAHILDEVYDQQRKKYGEVRRDVIRRVRHAWSVGPVDREEFVDVLQQRSLEWISGYLPFSRFFALPESEKIIDSLVNDVLEDPTVKFYQAYEIIRAKAEAYASSIAEMNLPLEDFEGEEHYDKVDPRSLIEPGDMAEITSEISSRDRAIERDSPSGNGHRPLRSRYPEPSKKSNGSLRSASFRETLAGGGRVQTLYTSQDIGRRPRVHVSPSDALEIEMTYLMDPNEAVLSIRDLIKTDPSFSLQIPRGSGISLIPDYHVTIEPHGNRMAIAYLSDHRFIGLAFFDNPLILRTNRLLPVHKFGQEYPLERFWLVNTSEMTSPAAKAHFGNAYDPTLKDTVFDKYCITSDAALAGIYSLAYRLNSAAAILLKR
jgi:hypothetical protein